MKYVVKKLPPAEWDLFEATLWYDDQGENLADQFLSEVDAAVRSLEVQPQIYGVQFADVRCVRLKRFHAYDIYFLIRLTEVWIIAVFHASRDPNELAARRTQIGS